MRFTGTLPFRTVTNPLSITTPHISANPGRPSTAPNPGTALLLASLPWSTTASTILQDPGGIDKVSPNPTLQQPFVASSLCKRMWVSPIVIFPCETLSVASYCSRKSRPMIALLPPKLATTTVRGNSLPPTWSPISTLPWTTKLDPSAKTKRSCTCSRSSGIFSHRDSYTG